MVLIPLGWLLYLMLLAGKAREPLGNWPPSVLSVNEIHKPGLGFVSLVGGAHGGVFEESRTFSGRIYTQGGQMDKKRPHSQGVVTSADPAAEERQ